MLSEKERLNPSKIPSNRLKLVFVWDEGGRNEKEGGKRKEEGGGERKEEGGEASRDEEGGRKREDEGNSMDREGRSKEVRGKRENNGEGRRREVGGREEGRRAGRKRELIELLGEDLGRFFGVGELGNEEYEGISLGVWTAKVVWRGEKLNYVGKLLVKQKMIK